MGSEANNLCELTGRQQEMVLESLRSIMESPHFAKSKRYPALLEYLVVNTLKGNQANLKERTVAIEVFGRPDTYDPSNDPIVRVAASEVRKRLALYFSEHPASLVRIDFPIGRYSAEFRFRTTPSEESEQNQYVAIPAPEPLTLPLEPVNAISVAASWRSHKRRWLFLSSAIFLIALAASAYWLFSPKSKTQGFWPSVLDNREPAMIVVGVLAEASDLSKIMQGQSNPSMAEAALPGGTSMANAMATAQICNIFREYGKSCDLVSSARANLSDLRNKTVVLIGLDNNWTRQLLMPLRYRFQSTSADPVSFNNEAIVDQNVTANQAPEWKVNAERPSETNYALIGRFHSEITDGIAVVAAGLTPSGTLGAEQFISSSESLNQLVAQAPKGWKGFNFEAVLQVDVIQGTPGHVKVVAAHYW